MNKRYQGALWRLPTKDEANTFIQAAERQPGYDLKGSGWTSNLYPGSKTNGWWMDFKRRAAFDRFGGTTRMDHGFRHACIRLVTEVCDIDPDREQRLENDGECWVDHLTGLAWRIHFIDEDGNDSDSGSTIWAGPLPEAEAIIDRFNRRYQSESREPKRTTQAAEGHSLTAQSIRAEWGDPTLVLTPGDEVSEDRKLLESIAEEYWVYLTDRADGGCIVYGRFKHRWVANPGCRWPMAELSRREVDAQNHRNTCDT